MQAVLITGSSTGIGYHTALHLDKLGFHVFAGVRKLEDAKRLKNEASDHLTPIILDVTQPDQIKQAAQQIAETVGENGLYALINNAGIAVMSPFEFIPPEDLRQQIEVNFTGHVLVTQAFIPLLREAQGRILNISSVSGTYVFPFFGAYAASKWALEAFTDALRQELYPWGIEVISIQPGSIQTPIWEKEAQNARERMADFPPEAFALYGQEIEVMQKRILSSGEGGLPVEYLTTLIHTALTTAKPKTRYFIAKNGWRNKILRLVPDRVSDWLVRRNLGAFERRV